MKKVLYVLVIAVVAFSLLGLAACKKEDEAVAAGEKGEKKIRVALYVNGTLGDKSFFDSANRGGKEPPRSSASPQKPSREPTSRRTGSRTSPSWPKGSGTS